MKAKLLEGKILAASIKEQLRNEVSVLKEKFSLPLTLTAIQVGENPSSEVYLRSQRKNAEKLGINYQLLKLAKDTKEGELIDLINKINHDNSIQGIILQMPLPRQINRQKIVQTIDITKDAEGMHPENLGNLFLGHARLLPCTAQAAMELVKSTAVELPGKEVVIVGHSEIVGKPLSLLFLNEFSTVTVCHIGTFKAGHLEEHIRRAEILVVAVGRANLVPGEWIREGAIVIDVGVNRLQDKIVGDIEFEPASERADFITPVPGGVGPLTVTMLMRNLVEAAKLQQE